MHIEANTKQVRAATRAVKKIFDKGMFSDIEAGNDCYLSTQPGGAALESAAGGLYVRAAVAANVLEAGRVVINRASLNQLRISGDTVALLSRDGKARMSFRSGRMSGELPVIAENGQLKDQKPTQIPETGIKIPTDLLKQAVKRVLLSEQPKEKPLRLRLTVSGTELSLSSNDHFRAAAITVKSEKPAGAGQIELPAAFFATCLQAADGPDVKIGFNDNVFRVVSGGYDVCHPILEAGDRPMPNIQAVIEAKNRQAPPYLKATVSGLELRDAVADVVSVAPVSTNNEVALTLKPDTKNTTLVAMVNATGAQAKYEVPCQALVVADGEEDVVMVNAKWLGELLGMVGADTLEVACWPDMVVISAEEIGCHMIMPQLSR